MMSATNKPTDSTSSAKVSVPQAPTPITSHQVIDEMQGTWFFEGKSYKAPEMQTTAPLAAVFKPSTGPRPNNPPYAHERVKFLGHGVASKNSSFHVGIILTGDDDIVAVTPLNDDFEIGLVNAKDGRSPVTKEELLTAVHPAKLDLESSPNPNGDGV